MHFKKKKVRKNKNSAIIKWTIITYTSIKYIMNLKRYFLQPSKKNQQNKSMRIRMKYPIKNFNEF